MSPEKSSPQEDVREVVREAGRDGLRMKQIPARLEQESQKIRERMEALTDLSRHGVEGAREAMDSQKQRFDAFANTASDIKGLDHNHKLFSEKSSKGGFARIDQGDSENLNVETILKNQASDGGGVVDGDEANIVGEHERFHAEEQKNIAVVELESVSKTEQHDAVMFTQQEVQGSREAFITLLHEADAMEGSRKRYGSIGNVSGEYKAMYSKGKALGLDRVREANEKGTIYVTAA